MIIRGDINGCVWFRTLCRVQAFLPNVMLLVLFAVALSLLHGGGGHDECHHLPAHPLFSPVGALQMPPAFIVSGTCCWFGRGVIHTSKTRTNTLFVLASCCSQHQQHVLRLLARKQHGRPDTHQPYHVGKGKKLWLSEILRDEQWMLRGEARLQDANYSA